MSGFALRKLAVLKRIEALGSPERERAEALYPVLDRIEYSCFAPFRMAVLFIPLSVLFALPFLKEVGPQVSEDRLWLCGFLWAALWYIVGMWLLKVLFFNKRRDSAVEMLNKSLMFDPTLHETLELLKELDPDMARNIRKYLPQPP